MDMNNNSIRSNFVRFLCQIQIVKAHLKEILLLFDSLGVVVIVVDDLGLEVDGEVLAAEDAHLDEFGVVDLGLVGFVEDGVVGQVFEGLGDFVFCGEEL